MSCFLMMFLLRVIIVVFVVAFVLLVVVCMHLPQTNLRLEENLSRILENFFFSQLFTKLIWSH